MANYYLDTSALAKCYLSEVGSGWVRGLANPAAGHVIIICDLTPVEFFSLLARRQREGTVNSANALILQTRFLADYEREYLSLPLEASVLERARNLISHQPLRSLDAVQLGSALEAAHSLGESVIFISSDYRLLSAARAEGLTVDDPNLHP